MSTAASATGGRECSCVVLTMKRRSWASTGWLRHAACFWSVVKARRSASLSTTATAWVDADGADQLGLQVGDADAHGQVQPRGVDPGGGYQRLLVGVRCSAASRRVTDARSARTRRMAPAPPIGTTATRSAVGSRTRALRQRLDRDLIADPLDEVTTATGSGVLASGDAQAVSRRRRAVHVPSDRHSRRFTPHP